LLAEHIEIRKASRLKEIDMKWRREIDYHGSRSYAAEEPKSGVLGRVAEWLASIAGRNEPKPVIRPKSANRLRVRTQQGFSVLGNSSVTLRKPAECPFPIAPGTTIDRRDFRLLP
jgi:hypothetical protein